MSIANKLTTIATNNQKVYDAGKEVGVEAGKEIGIEAGRKAEYDAFWDNYQANGARTDYAHAFRNGWTANTFKPKYNLTVKTGNGMFSGTTIAGDLREILKECNVILDTSQATSLNSMFYNNNGITAIGCLDARNATDVTYALESSRGLKVVEKFIFKDDGSQNPNIVKYTPKLTRLIVEGTIGQNGFSANQSPLDKESITSIVNCLSTTTSGLTVTLAKFAINKTFETSEGANDGTTSAEWLSLIGTKSNWTISLV